jgi:hypothetical protein
VLLVLCNIKLHLSATPRIDIASSQVKAHLVNFCLVASSPTTLPAVPFVKRPARNIASLDRAARKKKARLLEEMGADERDTQRYDLDDKVPIRQYYHSRTKQPMLNEDWDVDSDDDSTDDLWLRQISASVSLRMLQSNSRCSLSECLLIVAICCFNFLIGLCECSFSMTLKIFRKMKRCF